MAQVIKILLLLACLLSGQAALAMGCNDAKRSTPLFTGDWVEPVTTATDRMNVAYYGNLDPFTPSFIIKREFQVWHCFWDSDYWVFYDCGTHYDWDWLNSYATFSPSDWNSGTDAGPKAANGGTPITCLQRVAPGQTCLEGGTNKDIWSKVCGYVVNSAYGSCSANSNAWGFDWNHASFGCVHEPLKPGPPPFNKVYIGENAPTVVSLSVDEMVNRGSTFGYPKIVITSGQGTLNQNNLTLVNTYSTAANTDTQLTLTYDFNATAQTCQSFPASAKMPGTFCADVADDNPSQVCFCKQGHCSMDTEPYIMGCVARPTPKQSKLKMVAFYAKSSDGSPSITVRYLSSNNNGDLCLGSSSSPTSFCDQGSKTIIRHTPDQNYTPPAITTPFIDPTYKHTYSQNIQTQINNLGGLPSNSLGYFREYYYDSTKPNYPFLKDSITNGNAALFKKAYKLSFDPVIPSLTNPIVVIKNPINNNPPPATTCTLPQLMQSTTYLPTDLFKSVVPYKRNSLERNRHLTQDSSGTVTDPCNKMYDNYYGMCNPKALPVANDVIDSNTINRTFCPGAFVNTDIQHKICFTPVSNSWAELNAELATNYHDLCVNIPIVPNKTDPTNTPGCPSEKPAASNFYVNWPFMNPSATLAGTCDANYDLEARKTYSVSPGVMTQTNYCNQLCGTNTTCMSTCNTTNYTAYVTKFNAAQNALTARVELAFGQSRNLFAAEVQLIQTMLDATKIGTTTLHTINSTVGTVSKTCNSDGSVTRVGGCVYKPGCNANSTSNRFLGNMAWSSPTIDVTSGTPKTRLAAMTPDSLGLRGLAFPQTSTNCVVNPVPPATASTTATVATTTRWCNAYFNSSNVLQGKAWIDVDLSMPGAISCIAKNPT